jgi:hypothetical protein
MRAIAGVELALENFVQFLAPNRFGEITVHSRSHAAILVTFHSVGSQSHNRQMSNRAARR